MTIGTYYGLECPCWGPPCSGGGWSGGGRLEPATTTTKKNKDTYVKGKGLGHDDVPCLVGSIARFPFRDEQRGRAC